MRDRRRRVARDWRDSRGRGNAQRAGKGQLGLMDRYFLDTEFIDTGSTIDLISIGIVCSDGRELYLQSVEFDPYRATRWVHENVLAHLPLCPHVHVRGSHTATVDIVAHQDRGQCTFENPDKGIAGAHTDCFWRTRIQIMREVRHFFNPSDGFELWGWCAGYDFVAFCQIFGTMMDLPAGYPHHIKDIQYILDERGIKDEELPRQEEGLHNALEDARHIKKLWGYIVRGDAWQ